MATTNPLSNSQPTTANPPSHNPATTTSTSSASSSQPPPTTTHSRQPPTNQTLQPQENNNPFPGPSGQQEKYPPSPTDLPSEIPLLSRTHITTGYRSGVSDGKDAPETAQLGFDEGYPVGAALGMRSGFLLGALELCVGRLRVATSTVDVGSMGDGVGSGATERQGDGGAGGELVGHGSEGKEELKALVEQARVELGLDALLREVGGSGLVVLPSVAEREDDREDAPVPAGVGGTADRGPVLEPGWVEELPAIKKWSGILKELAGRVGVDFK